MRYLVIALIAAFAVSTVPASAKQIAAFKGWSAHSEGKGKTRICWIYSEPVKDEGNYKKRGRIYLLVTHRPGEKTFNQVQFTA
ncbi:MAG: invasion associated locus B family protein, partial [Alphaproteobacteria bacterium]